MSQNQSSNTHLRGRSLEALEWSLICDALASRTRSPLGGALAYRHAPFSTPSESRRLRQRVIEGQILVDQSPAHGYVSGATDVNALLDRANRDGILDPAELHSCGHFLQTVGLLGDELRARAATTPFWAEDFAPAPPTPSVCEKIQRSVSSDGAVLDTASAELARLRRSRGEKRIEFEATLQARLKEWSNAGLLQDHFYDQIDGRYVVPVKVELQSKLEGSLMSRSNTGQSVFIEPAELRTSNNALKEIDLAIRAEEFRILRMLSGEIGSHAPAFMPWIAVVAEFDLALAAARLAKDWSLSAPIVPDHDQPLASLELGDVFHPGLKLRAVDIVTNSFSLPKEGHTILISGPNTGGKTVLLKAAALSACMARAGLLIPAAPGSKIPHYADVFAFIGDDQNIAAGLSSFSAQIMLMKAVLEDTSGPFLLVIDEILSSTDPEEASALAQALIEEFIARGHHVIVTSHFSELSLRCKTNPKITVAAMEFDSGSPTYRLRLDELGSSHALEVASKLGFPERTLTRARALLSTAKLDYEKAQAELRKKEQDLELAFESARSAFEREQERFKKETLGKFEAFARAAQAKLEEAVQNLSARLATYTRQGSAQNISKAIDRLESAAKDALREIDTAKSAVVSSITGQTQNSSGPLPLVVGARVKVKSMRGAKGIVLEVKGTGSAQSALVQVGNFRLEARNQDLEVLEAAAPKTGFAAKNNYVGFESSGQVERKLDLRGRRYDEAISEAERYIDQAFRSGAAQVTIVTGHGTGALKQGLKELLAGLPYIREFRPERDGNDGATLIEFER